MPAVITLTDQEKIVTTAKFPKYAKFPFPAFNPVQSRVFEIFEEDANCIIAAATSAGKTVCAEMFMANEVRVRGGKAMYLAPLKALAKEKVDDWTSGKHHFGDLNLSICTGDYQLTIARKRELEEAQIVLMTSEMLNSRVRNYESEQNEWLQEVGTLVVDESHLLTVPGRGDKLEVGLMKFAGINPNARLVFLSATMPNVQEIAEWVSDKLTHKQTYLINSTYRPCPLAKHYPMYQDQRFYDGNEAEKVSEAIDLVQEYPDDKFLIFAHTKRTGQMMLAALKQVGIAGEFHNADLEKEKRHEVEKRFREDKSLRCIVATSTLAWGLNLPARRVIILGVHRGLDIVGSYDIIQMAGRAGRVGLDPRGDVYILLPRKDYVPFKDMLNKPENINSRLLDFVGKDANRHYKTLAFHLVSEIHHGNVETREDIQKWYVKSLAHFQANDLDDQIVKSTLESLLKCGAVKDNDGDLEVTPVGQVASMFYYSPFDVADLKRNFDRIFEHKLQRHDLYVTLALGNIDTIKFGIVSRAERDEMGAYYAQVQKVMSGVLDTAIKGGYAYYAMLNGIDVGAMAGFARNLKYDFPRLIAVLRALDSMAGHWGQSQFLERLNLRMTYGVRDELVELCMIPAIGKVRAEKLWAAGLHSLEDVADNEGNRVGRVLNMKPDKIAEIVLEARKMSLTSSR